jgi:hypothetical protein
MREFNHESDSLSKAIGFTDLEFDAIQDKVAELGAGNGAISKTIEKITKEYTDPVELVFAGMVLGGAMVSTKRLKHKGSLWEELKK